MCALLLRYIGMTKKVRVGDSNDSNVGDCVL